MIIQQIGNAIMVPAKQVIAKRKEQKVRKVLFLTHSLGGGGAERVLINLVNHMNCIEFDITVETLFADGVNRERLHSDIRYISRKAPYFRGITRICAFIPPSLLYRYFVGKDKYDIVIAYMHGLPTRIVLGAPKGTKKVTWLHCGDMKNTSLFSCYHNMKSAVRSLAKLDGIIGVAQSVSDAFSQKTGITKNVFTCYNTNNIDEILRKAAEPIDITLPNGPVICSVGRFTKEKGFERLIELSAKLNAEKYNHTLLLIGAGQLLDAMKRKAMDMAYDKVVFTGFQENPYSYMSKADMFVCSSFYEGLSTAATEAIILGLPCLSTDVSGAKEILGEHNEYGVVVDNNEDALYEGIKSMLIQLQKGTFDRSRLKERAQLFSVENTVGQVENLLIDIMEKLV